MACLNGDLEPSRSQPDVDLGARAVSERQPEWDTRQPATAAGAGQQASHERRHTARGDWHPSMETVNGHATLAIEQRELLAQCHHFLARPAIEAATVGIYAGTGWL